MPQQIPDDGEGASHLIEIQVSGTACKSSAIQIAKSIANSALVKTAIAGADPNWGRIVSAAGYAGVKFDVESTSLEVNGFELYRSGVPLPFHEKTVSDSIRENRKTEIKLSVGNGDSRITFWTSDLTVDYVKFNSDYHT